MNLIIDPLNGLSWFSSVYVKLYSILTDSIYLFHNKYVHFIALNGMNVLREEFFILIIENTSQ